MTDPKNEQQLIEGCKAGECWAQKAIYESYAPVMLGVCVRYLGEKEAAKDALQEGFIKLFGNIGTFAGTGNFGGWARRIFVNACLEQIRKNQAYNLTDTIENHLHALAEEEDSGVRGLSAEELLFCITKLPKTHRAVFNLFAIEGYSHREIAEMLQITESTSRTLFSRARGMLKEMVNKLEKR